MIKLRVEIGKYISTDELGQWVEIDIYNGDKCVLNAEIDDELPFSERIEIATTIASIINGAKNEGETDAV